MSLTQNIFSLRQQLDRLRLKQKFTLATFLVAVVAASVASVVLLLFRLQALKEDRLASAGVMSRIVADNVTGAVAFDDATAAADVLYTLKAQPLVIGALVRTPKQDRFAVYGQIPSVAQSGLADESHFENWIVNTRTPIRHDREIIGYLYIQTDLNPALARTLRGAAVALLFALLTASVIGYILARFLRHFILQPIDALSLTTRLVTKNADYSLRAAVVNKDELGELAEAFNQMLASLQTSDAALRSANAQLQETLLERTRLEKDLVAASRQAGMAQVATGVLHNVGNVLNSVNISAQVIKQALSSNANFTLFQQATQLLREQGPDAGQFLANDPRGQLLPAFFIQLGEQIEALRGELLKENEQLTENIEHIKQIIVMQQGYAKAGGLSQKVAPADLFNEACRLVHGSLERHNVTVTTKFAELPAMITDRHQVLQILVNFISNALQATKLAKTSGQREIVLQLHSEAQKIIFSVIDNGVGISPENLGKVFGHGFTTRKDGHGFGLHSGALVARNLGGQIKAQSDGPGLGACFTLTLPITNQEKSLTIL